MHNVHLMPNPVTQPYPGLPSTQDSREPFDGIWPDQGFRTGRDKSAHPFGCGEVQAGRCPSGFP